MRYILWSGGFDSTYLLCKCARETDEDIQPIYIIFPEAVDRGSAVKEMEAQDELLPLIRIQNGIKATILPPIRIKEQDLPTRAGFEEAYEKVQNNEFLSRRYMYRALGKLTDKFPNLMVGIEAPPDTVGRGKGNTVNALSEHGIDILPDGTVSLRNNGDVDMYSVFKGLQFCMINTTAHEELEAFKDWGYEELIPLCRTCCTGLNQACGVCAACKTKMECGEDFKRYMPRGYVNYQIKEYIEQFSELEAYYFTLFVWGGGRIRTGRFHVNIGRCIHDMFISSATAKKYEAWFNALLDNYPNFNKANRTDYGIE